MSKGMSLSDMINTLLDDPPSELVTAMAETSTTQGLLRVGSGHAKTPKNV